MHFQFDGLFALISLITVGGAIYAIVAGTTVPYSQGTLSKYLQIQSLSRI